MTQNITLDGSIEMIDDWFVPETSTSGEMTDWLEEVRRQDADADAMLLGRQTFEDFRGYWPLQTDDATGFTAHLNQVQKYVVSSTMTDPAWENSTVLSGRLEDELAALKSIVGGEIGVTGSISVVHALMRADLVDEYRLFVYPVFTSRGRHLVPEGLSMHGLTLAEAHSFPSGVALLRYTRT